ncbi:MAG: hypothetical protein VX107_16390, partial [Pseudomonadota bacterium]|nr:hypothetical protein [Pseudomonadota bacterium]
VVRLCVGRSATSVFGKLEITLLADRAASFRQRKTPVQVHQRFLSGKVVRLAAHQPYFLAAQGLQPFFAGQGMQPRLRAQGLQFAS